MEEPLEIEDFLEMASAALALVLFVLTLLAHRRRPTRRTLLLATAFGAFALRGALNVASDLLSEEVGDALASLAIPLEIAFLALVAVAFLRA